MNQSHRFVAQVPEHLAGMRLDQALVEIFPDYSRSKLQAWIRSQKVTVDGRCLRPKDRVEGGESVELDAEPEAVVVCAAQDIPLDIVYEDAALLIVDKRAGLVVHPAAGNPAGTLQNALLHYDPNLAGLPRAGIVHRIDKDTSGLLMIARTLKAHHSLVEQLQDRSIVREYLALTNGRMTAGGTVDAPIGRHPTDRKRFAVREHG
ncbi:MAG: pseudouridine synthase, partial [Pseudomonadota bacterium]